MTEGGGNLMSTFSGNKTQEVKQISTNSDPLDMLIHANQQLGKFLDSMKEPVNKTPVFNNEFNLKITENRTINDIIKKLETKGKINILNEAYSKNLRDYLLKDDNILTQYNNLLLQLIPETPGE